VWEGHRKHAEVDGRREILSGEVLNPTVQVDIENTIGVEEDDADGNENSCSNQQLAPREASMQGLPLQSARADFHYTARFIPAALRLS
jgi:hypothetical protein